TRHARQTPAPPRPSADSAQPSHPPDKNSSPPTAQGFYEGNDGSKPSCPSRILRDLRGRFVFYRSSGTIQNGFEPRATRWQLSKALRQGFGWLSQVGPAECALKMAFFSVNSS